MTHAFFWLLGVYKFVLLRGTGDLEVLEHFEDQLRYLASVLQSYVEECVD